jgi:CBS domain-containing protein
MYVQQIMSRNVATVEAGTSLTDAIQIMLQQHVSGLPVILAGNRELIGILTEGDLLHRVELDTGNHRWPWFIDRLVSPAHSAKEYIHTHSKRVEDLMTRNVITTQEDTPLSEAISIMEHKHIRCLPVVNNHILVGLLDRIDLMRHISSLLNDKNPNSADDEEIHKLLTLELYKEPWYQSADITFKVNNGVITVTGTITNKYERDAVLAAAHNIHSVKLVEDKMVWLQPMPSLATPFN